MCRYASKRYKTHFACFDCRKSFKRPPIEDLVEQNGDWEAYKASFWYPNDKRTKKYNRENPEKVSYLTAKYIKRKEICPDCGEELANLGLDFKAPKKGKSKEWDIIRGMYTTGHMFQSCGCQGIGFVPKKKEEYIDYLEKRKKGYEDRLKRKAPSLIGEALSEYLERYSTLISLIDEELSRL